MDRSSGDLMKRLVGTSGYSYKEWKGSFYPDDLPAAKFLRYYSERFATVEANNTFYKMPTAKQLSAWLAEVPSGFQFAIKAPQRITHQQRLEGSEDSVELLLSATAALGDKLGPFLFQLPPFLKKDISRLKKFLAIWPGTHRAAFEFRHASWFDDETYQVLREAGAALCIAEAEKLETPLVATARWGYLRLRREDYTQKDVAKWAAQILAQPWEQVYVYFKHEDAGTGPKLAQQLLGSFESLG
jgi:uncharacterized protein YecE (DUF72 family)